MLADAHVHALLSARHADPFSVLGLHPDDEGQMWLRVCWPNVAAIDVLDAKTGKRLTGLALRDPDGFFEGTIPRRKQRFAYRLRLFDAQGLMLAEVADAYAFGPQLPDAELLALKAGLHPRPYTVLGAHALVQQGVAGVRFAVWAPNAKRVSVVGDFNQWDGRRHPMRYRHEAGVWEIFVPHVIEGDLYKFELVSREGALLPLKADPYARAARLRPETASKVAPMPPVRALPPGRAAANGAMRRSRSTRCTPRRGSASAPAPSRAGTTWPRRCRPMWPTWASPTSSCCRSPSTRSTAPGAIRRWVSTLPAPASARRRVSTASWPPAMPAAWACCWTGCRRTSRATRMAWPTSTARRCTNTPTRARACTATGTR